MTKASEQHYLSAHRQVNRLENQIRPLLDSHESTIELYSLALESQRSVSIISKIKEYLRNTSSIYFPNKESKLP